MLSADISRSQETQDSQRLESGAADRLGKPISFTALRSEIDLGIAQADWRH